MIEKQPLSLQRIIDLPIRDLISYPVAGPSRSTPKIAYLVLLIDFIKIPSCWVFYRNSEFTSYANQLLRRVP